MSTYGVLSHYWVTAGYLIGIIKYLMSGLKQRFRSLSGQVKNFPTIEVRSHDSNLEPGYLSLTAVGTRQLLTIHCHTNKGYQSGGESNWVGPSSGWSVIVMSGWFSKREHRQEVVPGPWVTPSSTEVGRRVCRALQCYPGCPNSCLQEDYRVY